MSNAKYQVAGIGNAIVDVLANVEDAFLETEGLNKGAMQLIDADQAKALYANIPPAMEASGGSAANTVADLASLGGTGSFMGKVRDDQLGEIFSHDLKAIGVEFSTEPATTGPETARCIVLVTNDGERTLNTYLGACVAFGPDDVNTDIIADSQVTYLEGYLFDPPAAKEAFFKAADAAHAAGRQVSLSLSDPFCVDRYRDEFRTFVKDHVDILCANEDEIISLYQTSSFDDAANAVRENCAVSALTRGAKGSVVVAGADTVAVPAAAVDRVVDTTGAGDAYAAGFLFGLTSGRDHAECARLGGIAAAEIISHFGARPETELKTLI